MSEEQGFDLTFEGLVAADAEPDDMSDAGETWQLNTLRINGADVLATLAAAVEGLTNPVVATVTVDGQVLASGRLWFEHGYGEVGCADGCCGGIVDHVLMVGGDRWEPDRPSYDVLEYLNGLHRGTHEVRIHGNGWVAPKVDVTLAHHTWHGPLQGPPLTRAEVPLRVADSLRHRITTASRDRLDAALRADREAREAIA